MDVFAQRLLDWFDRHGRHDLPWQQGRSPYSVWVSEIMLQQTQVATVIPYYQRFMARFPDVASLAAASEDTLMAHWAGLGYYSRARNLQAAAKQVMTEHGGVFPQQQDALLRLPGIGRSTAGAILSLACNQASAILDGNVKRVLCRYHAIDGWPGQRQIEQQLWQLAAQHTPAERFADYTQAIMDLGATVCRRSKPLCGQCPQQSDCQAHAQQRCHELPTRKPRPQLPVRHTTMLLLQNPSGELLLHKRAGQGIWGGLWSLPECPHDQDVERWCEAQLGLQITQTRQHDSLTHVFSHFRLHIHPLSARAQPAAGGIMEANDTVWYNTGSIQQLGLPAPVKTLVHRLVMTKESNT
jgi:A/G-specific adenine glycosylase